MQEGFATYPWRFSYKTSTTIIDGKPVNILQDFYVPALKRIVKYDRVAGYFRSSSLAAASQGFSAFIGNQGKMRMIVGADLEPDDVAAILAGDQARLEHRLQEELAGKENWPESVQSGMELLSWMVAHGFLEVRVALRKHGVTGEPVPFDSIADGYVHEKWFVMEDVEGKRLYGSGTLNESKTGLLINAENIDIHCDWWEGRDILRVNEAVAAFEKLWVNEVPHMPVYTMPEAVRNRLVQFAEGVVYPKEIDGTSAVIPALVNLAPSAIERLRFGLLKDAPKMPGGRYVGMTTAPVELWPHQEIVVRRLIESWPYSYLLCDEVGLGKTIEAGLAIRSLHLSGLAKRVLIAAPAKLTHQWQREMASKALMSFGRTCSTPELRHEYIFPYEESRLASSVVSADLTIVSTGLLTRKQRRSELDNMHTVDIILVDEAHYARRQNPTKGTSEHPVFGQLYTVIRDCLRKAARSLWLATATPMQIHPVEVADLLALVNRVGAFQFDPTLTQQYYDILSKLLHSQDPAKHEWEFLRKAVLAVKRQDPFLWQFVEQTVIDGRVRLPLKHWMERGTTPRGNDSRQLVRLLFSIAPLSRVMLRHTRQLLEVYKDNNQLSQNLAKRILLPIPQIEFTAIEKQAYEDLEEYCDELTKQVEKSGDANMRQMTSFLLSFLRLRFASSLFAIKESLRRRLEKVELTLHHQTPSPALTDTPDSNDSLDEVSDWDEEDEEEIHRFVLKHRSTSDLEWEQGRLKLMLAHLADITGYTSKMKVLLTVLEGRKDKKSGRILQTVVFTRFRDTLLDIVVHLQKADSRMRIGIYTGQEAKYYDSIPGQLLATNHEQVKAQFLQGEIDVLLCTDAAAEGLNLQTADMLINYDLGWNPMKIEQRIGRIDRIGQKHAIITVLNLCYPDSAEGIVYGRLLTRLAEAKLIVGTQQISLLPVTAVEFEALANHKISSEQLEKLARKKLTEQSKHAEVMEVSPKDLYEIYMRLKQVGTERVPVTLSSMWDVISQSDYLSSIGCTVATNNGESYLRVAGIASIPDGTMLTISRKLVQEGCAEGDSRMQFASYGNPSFDRLVDHVAALALPACIRRVVVQVPINQGIDGELVGYAIACSTEDNQKNVRLILSWEDMKDLTLAEAEAVTDGDVQDLSEQLMEIAEKEFISCRQTSAIERDNVRAAMLHEVFTFMVIRELLEVKGKHAGGEAKFSTIIRDIETLYDDANKKISINELPASVFRDVTGELLFDCQVPQLSTQATAVADHLLAKSAIDASRRIVSTIRKRGRDATSVAEATRRLKVEEDRRLKDLKKFGIGV